uniref:Uncharacterized protein n=1 Tax=Fusarium ficicrescens TaxID=1688603 RepID=A0A6M4B1D5_9HYPO|nr:hypothetical protein [Fusarium ficicrescens]
MVVINETIDNDLVHISNLLNVMDLDAMYIFSINFDDSIQFEVFELEHRSNVKYIEVGLRFFIENYLENPNNEDFWPYNLKTLYILRGGNYSDLQELFTTIQNTKVRIVRGSSQKSHVVSPVDFRLSCYSLILCKMSYKKFNSYNSFNSMQKDRYLPTYS